LPTSRRSGALKEKIERAGRVCYHEGTLTTKKTSKQAAKHRSTTKQTAGAKKKPAKKAAVREAPRGKKAGGRSRREPAALEVMNPREVAQRRDSLAVAKVAIAAALDKKAVEPVLIDVCGRASYADFIGVVSGRSDRQVDAIAEGVCEAMAAQGRRPIGREGARNGRWVLIDFGDVVLHVFYHPLREVFDIESLWIDAPRIKLRVPAEAAEAASNADGP
jgi:ribosome-associated protein